jgi:hypothetical protein
MGFGIVVIAFSYMMTGVLAGIAASGHKLTTPEIIACAVLWPIVGIVIVARGAVLLFERADHEGGE